jgi:hypothetical protein
MITIDFIKPESNRYVTHGDWYEKDGNMVITSTAYGNENGSFLISLHELVEAWLCKHDGVAEEDVSAWDLCHPDAPEPAEVEGSPYRKQHDVATQVEKIVCAAMGIDWENHNRWVEESASVVEECLNIRPAN